MEMKIRTDFVTNSSSSNFTVEITLESKDKKVILYEDPLSHNEDEGDEASFVGDLRDINRHLSSVGHLARWLAECVRENRWDSSESVSLKKKKEKFVQEAKNAFKSVKDIDSITIERHYDAYGEFADLVGDDAEMVQLAKNYIERKGIAKERAKAEMVTHIKTAVDARGDSFGANCKISRFDWKWNNVDSLAERLCSRCGPNTVSGVERKKLDLRTGEYFDESDFDLS